MSLDFYDLVTNISATGARGRHPHFSFWTQGECCAGGTGTQEPFTRVSNSSVCLKIINSPPTGSEGRESEKLCQKLQPRSIKGKCKPSLRWPRRQWVMGAGS